MSRWTLRVVLLLAVADMAYVASIWPNWKRLERGPVPETRFIRHYQFTRAAKHWPALRWDPVPLEQIPGYAQRAVIVAEDSRFYQERDGFDPTAIRDAFLYDVERRRIVYGASTISQQTAKNLFLTPSRSFLRKLNETLLTWGLTHHLSKRRILEIYLNTAQFGRGIYGIEAASEAYWGIPASDLSLVQAVDLAATLPSPVRNNPAHRGPFFMRHSRKILGEMVRLYGDQMKAPDSTEKAGNSGGAVGAAPGMSGQPQPHAGSAPVGAGSSVHGQGSAGYNPADQVVTYNRHKKAII